jgi:hypothetical protein
MATPTTIQAIVDAAERLFAVGRRLARAHGRVAEPSDDEPKTCEDEPDNTPTGTEMRFWNCA